MNKVISFDDVLLVPKFSSIVSRQDIDTTTNIGGLKLKLPIISSPMDTITTPQMAKKLAQLGGIGALHRFGNIEAQLADYKQSEVNPIVSVGLNDWERVEALKAAGADRFLLDIAHGAQEQVVKWVHEFRNQHGSSLWLMIGNFATKDQIETFITHLGYSGYVNAWRIGVGSGAACSTQVQTGHGMPTLASLLDVKSLGISVVADGGIKTPGDLTKALAAGASAVLLGRTLAGTDETPTFNGIKLYRGSASAESYAIQNKNQKYITPEGVTYTVDPQGPVESIVNNLIGGLRSGMSYSGALTLTQLQNKATFVEVTSNGVKESKPHGKTR